MTKPAESSLPTVAVILAAGRGTRMQSAEPKVLHRAAGRPLLEWVVRSAREAGCQSLLVVVGHQSDRVRAHFEDSGLAAGITWVEQSEQRGTGDALARAVEHLPEQAEPAESAESARLLILSGDVPLVRPETLREMLSDSAKGSGWLLAAADLETPGALGRLVPGAAGTLSRIVEAADATPDELEINSVNAGIYVAPSAQIATFLARLEPANAQGELYLTDAFTAAAAAGIEVGLFELADWNEALGVNDRSDLARVHRQLLDRKINQLMAAGVTVLEPERTVIEAAVEIGPDSVIHPGTALLGRTSIGAGSTIHANCWIRDAVVGENVEIGPMTVIEQAEVGERSRVGPFARLRPGASLGAENRIGNFVEIKNSQLADGVKAGHLAYLGDAEIGAGANIGAGTVTCNYDGREKHRTEIGAESFVGSDTMLVAPVRVGKRATTAAGSVITSDVPEGALGVSRMRQKNLDGWADRKRKKKD